MDQGSTWRGHLVFFKKNERKEKKRQKANSQGKPALTCLNPWVKRGGSGRLIFFSELNISHRLAKKVGWPDKPGRSNDILLLVSNCDGLLFLGGMISLPLLIGKANNCFMLCCLEFAMHC